MLKRLPFLLLLVLTTACPPDNQPAPQPKTPEPPVLFRKRIDNMGVRQALSICRNGTWHVVEYELKGGTKTEIDDQDSGISCELKAPDIVAKYGKTTHDQPPCASPTAIELAEFLRCLNGVKQMVRYRVVTCVDGTTRLELPRLSATPVDPPERCDE